MGQQEMSTATAWLNLHKSLLLKGQMARNSSFEPPIRWLMSKNPFGAFVIACGFSPQGFLGLLLLPSVIPIQRIATPVGLADGSNFTSLLVNESTNQRILDFSSFEN